VKQKTDYWRNAYRYLYQMFYNSSGQLLRNRWKLGDNRHGASVRYADIQRAKKRGGRNAWPESWTSPRAIEEGTGRVKRQYLTDDDGPGAPPPPPSVDTGEGMTAGVPGGRAARELRGRLQGIMARIADRDQRRGGGGMLAGLGARRAVQQLRARVLEQAAQAGAPATTDTEAAELLTAAAAALVAAQEAAGDKAGEVLAEGAAAGDPASTAGLMAYIAAAEAAADDGFPEVPRDITPAEAAALLVGADGGGSGDLVTVDASDLQDLIQMVGEAMTLLGEPCACL
jgi:hypothetical protein